MRREKRLVKGKVVTSFLLVFLLLIVQPLPFRLQGTEKVYGADSPSMDRPLVGIINYSGLTAQNKSWDEASLTPPKYHERLPFYAVATEDESRIVRTSNTEQEFIYYSEADITNFRVYAAFDDSKPYDLENDIRIYSSSDGETYTVAPTVGLSGRTIHEIQGADNWQKVNITTAYEPDIHYVKVVIGKTDDDNPLNPQIMRTELYYRNATLTDLIRSVDNLDDYSRIYEYSGGITLDSANPERFRLVAADDNEADIVEQQIAYANSAGINYIAYLDMQTNWYTSTPRVFDLYRQSENKGDLEYAVIMGNPEDGGETWEMKVDRLLEYFADSFYVRVHDDRPLLYLMNLHNWSKEQIDLLRGRSIDAGLGDPFVTGMTDQEWFSHFIDAASEYATVQADVAYNYGNTPYTIPLVSFGVNDEPRQDNPPPWGAWTPTEPRVSPEEVRSLLKEALDWTIDNPDKNPANSVLIYAWNEHAEAAANVEPTLNADGTINTTMLDTIGATLAEYEPSEAAPEATNVSISGTAQVGQTLTGNYTYADVDGDLEGESLYQWYRSDDADGLNKQEITGATTQTYMIVEADLGKYISFAVTPAAATGMSPGATVESASTSAVIRRNSSPPSTGGIVPVQPTTDTQVLINDEIIDGISSLDRQINNRTIAVVTIDGEKLKQHLEAAGDRPVVTIEMQKATNAVIAEMNAEFVSHLQNKQAIIQVRGLGALYNIPAEQIALETIVSTFGSDVELRDVIIQIEVSEPQEAEIKAIEQAKAARSFQIVAGPVHFSITSVYKNEKASLNRFDSYVEHIISLPARADADDWTTGVIIEPDGTMRHLPTRIMEVDGARYAVIRSMTSGTIAVIANSVAFVDVSEHWSKAIVNAMGARMVVTGDGNDRFAPDEAITRAEFTSFLVRGLGLEMAGGSGQFADISEDAWYHRYIQTAYEHGIIAGIGDGRFAPNKTITREQAMTIIANSMKITGLSDTVKQMDQDGLAAFRDVDKVSSWAQGGVAQVVAANIVSGRSSGQLAPKATLTRAETAVLIARLLQRSGFM